MSDYLTEFPDFASEPMPVIPSTWVDGSWRNDSCPLFYVVESGSYESGYFAGVMIAVDYADPDKREHEGAGRFGVYDYADGVGAELYEGDDWDAVRAHVLAHTFGTLFAVEVTPEELETVRQRNATTEYAGTACATHDVRDANDVMAKAFALVMGAGTLDDSRTDADGAMTDADCALWNAAWAVAKPLYFTAPAPKAES